jgi:HD-GYP domain-containing protein (c-di-GMP phosphodiesterase class II)
MRRHPSIGAEIVSPIRFLAGAVEIVRSHHERWDGGGYPRGLRGEQIPLAARIFALADSFDAMTSDRPYRDAMPVERALGEIADEVGTQFDPDVAGAFLELAADGGLIIDAEAAPLAAAI